jgi:hypothetical protein
MMEAGITGAALAQSDAGTQAYYERFGIPTWRIAKWLLRREQLILVHDFASPPSLDPCSAFYGETTEVHIELHLIDLISIDETKYEFTAQFAMLSSWKDDRPFNIFSEMGDQKLSHLHGDGSKCTNPCFGGHCCDLMWRPDIAGENALLMTASSTAKDKGLLWPAKDTALQYQEFTGTFKADHMDFRDFPYDKQELFVDLVIPELHTSSKDVKLVPTLSQESSEYFAEGNIDGAARSFVIRSVDVEGNLYSNGALNLLKRVNVEKASHPLKKYVEEVRML